MRNYCIQIEWKYCVKDGDTFDLIRPSDDLTYLNEFEYPLRKDLTLKLIHRYSQFITRQQKFSAE